MVKSMTAFARSEEDNDLGRITVEIKSVNNRYLEPVFRLPESLRELEPQLRDILSKAISRGKVECTLRFHPTEGGSAIKVDENAVQHLLQAADQVQNIIGPGQAMNVLEVLQWPGVLIHEQENIDIKTLSPLLFKQFEICLADFIATRGREGEGLAEHIRQRLNKMNKLVEIAQQAMPAALEAQRQNLENKLGELKQQLDEGRLEAEMVLLAQKADVAEELDRLTTHLQEVERILQQNEPIGRRLDFMMQELNREANTLSSKALTSEITNVAVDMKVLIEQMREQIQNIE